MSLFEAFSYRNKRALVVGGATGMGAAVAELVRDAGAEVVVMDRAQVTLKGVRSIALDLADKTSIDKALAECGGRVHTLFSCAGVADGTPGIERINFIGHRYLIDRMFAREMLPPGSAIGFISSAAGMGWEANLPLLTEFLKIDDFDAATAWVQEHGKADYMWSKQAICAYVARMALPLLKRGVRINAILPGPTDTPLARANADRWLTFGADYRKEANVEVSTSLEQAWPLVFLCSDAAAVISGITLITDVGFVSSAVSESFPSAKMIVNFPRGSNRQARDQDADRRQAGPCGEWCDLPQREPGDRTGPRRSGRRLARRHAPRHRGSSARVRRDGLVGSCRRRWRRSARSCATS
jgi:NAD(P)-dependent dehydrogenase (short-subunit alcohol dehydrogenase family)